MKLIVVESPTKCRTLARFLGKEYRLEATMGHIRDLPKEKLGVDVEKNFEPSWLIVPGKRKVIAQLKKVSPKAKKIYLASVDYKEPILIRHPNGIIDQVRVGSFIDEVLKKKINLSLFKIPAFDAKTQKVYFKKIKDVSRHRINEELLEVVTDYGRRIKITASHSVFTKDKKGKIKPVAGKDLKVGDRLLVPLNLPLKTKKIKEIDLLRAIYENKELRGKVFINSPLVSEYRRNQILARKKGKIPQFQPRLIFTSKLREALRDKRRKVGWSQRFLADKINSSQSNICDWERGEKNPTLPLGEKYLRVLGFSLEVVLKSKEAELAPSSIEVAIRNALENQWRDSRKSLSRSWQPLSWFNWKEIERNFRGDKKLVISRHNHSHLMPRFIPVNRDLMLFLGFLVAEGSFLDKEKYLRFSFGKREIGGEKKNVERVKRITKKLFNLSPGEFEERTSTSIVLKSTLVTFLIKEVLGFKGGAAEKKVPWIVFNVSPSFQLAFLEGLFLGDGSLTKQSITFNTVSSRLTEGIRFLLLANRILNSCTIAFSKRPNRKPLYMVSVASKSRLAKIRDIWEGHYRASILENYLQSPSKIKRHWSKVINQRNDLGLLRIRKIRRVKPSSQFVYDFSVDGENFICGSSGVCAHNTDPDREGEAIAWHVAQILAREKLTRIVFHEITREAIENALKNPRDIDMNLVSAQKARRILDRLVGYKLSPLLWRKIRRGLSAGRVQSVAVRLIVEREREIEKFIAEEYWRILAALTKNKAYPFLAELVEKSGEKYITKKTIELFSGTHTVSKTSIVSQDQAEAIIKGLTAPFVVEKVEKKEALRYPPPPFTTSTLQQTAGGRFGWSGKLTMKLAQDLYERGLITYHRTDSTQLSPSALQKIRRYIRKNFPDEYLPKAARIYKTRSKVAQEAHEAIRPTNIKMTKNLIPKTKALARNHQGLYELIWQRTVGCQMSAARLEKTNLEITSGEYRFESRGQRMLFDGFLKVYPLRFSENILPAVKKGDQLDLVSLGTLQSSTSPPARYTEAGLVKTLEKEGIGRPSTYAPIISLIQDRQYVEKLDGKFQSTNLGEAVNDFLVKEFPDIVDIPFTAKMEDELDSIARGERQWVTALKAFYQPFEKKLGTVEKKAKRVKIETPKTGEKCPQCGGDLVMRIGKFGKFIACSNFPECKHTQPYIEKVAGVVCPKCGGEVIIKKTKKGKRFYGCLAWPKCDWASWRKPK